MGQDISREICAKIPQRIKDDLRYVQVELKRDLSHFSREAVAVKDVALISHSEIRGTYMLYKVQIVVIQI